jgi:hypothetical protein
MSEFIFDREKHFENFVNTVQYIMRLTPQQDIYENISLIMINYFKTDWVTFASFDQPTQRYVYQEMVCQKGFQDTFKMETIDEIVADVFENGFLALESVFIPELVQLVFLPLKEEGGIKTVMILAHKHVERLPRDLINSYLALSELVSTALELRRHRSKLEEIILERTKELKSTNRLLNIEINERKQINEKINKELIIANIFQTALMSNIKKFDLADVYGKYIPCSMVGGDLLGMECDIKYYDDQVNISTGEMVLLYTDGLFDLKNTEDIDPWDRIRN